ncbi:MAG: hypothetical protein VXZ25_01575 [Pseudomonadota bacterium]|nr:hypothetical protein [Pseudomonadota bacterium]
MSWQILGGRVLSDRGIKIDDVRIVDGKITSRRDFDAQIFNASGNLVLPGIVDVCLFRQETRKDQLVLTARYPLSGN